MLQIDVDGLLFEFPDRWIASKYDEWKFYRDHWSRMWNEIKAVDVIAVDPARTGWRIEVKDYTQMKYDQDERPAATDLGQVVAKKIFDTLAAMLPARLNAIDHGERNAALLIAGSVKLRVVLHLEQPATKSRLRTRAIDPANIRQKLRQLIKPIDPHPAVTAMAQMDRVPWHVVRA